MEPGIRAATEGDAEQLAAFSLVVWDEAYRGILDPDALRRRHDEAASVREGRWAARIADEDVLVAFDAQGLAGFARSTRPAFAGVPKLLGLYTRQRSWGSGLGSRLLARSLPARSAQLWLFDGNVRALRFYERHGFALDGRRRADPPYGFELHMRRR
ncbi:GNAT family N-acetyltransferase [Herbiconiux liangxiaofengii]|uniref:GNAT family N-acetyltransferase n=1 Tax=Herbiconiux liangxiaofengii TaxID=3342795 RepID=UPI0035BA7DC9